MPKLNIFQQVRELQDWRATVFANALVTRMFPNYQLFCEATEFAEAKDLATLLDLIWEKVSSPKAKINIAVQLEKLEELTPDIDNFSGYGVYPALDCAVSVEAILNQLSGEDPQGAVVVSKLSQGGVEGFIEFTSESPLSREDLKQHPLMQREIEFQQLLLEKVTSQNKISKDFVKEIKQLCAEDGMSNIGIELEI